SSTHLTSTFTHIPPTLFFFSLLLCTPRSTPFPYTTLFRSTDDDLATLEHLLTARARDLPGLRTPVRWYWIARRTEVSILLPGALDRKSTRLNSSHVKISYAVFCLKKKKTYCKSPKTSR